MIDLHSHLLPGIDDGPKQMSDSIEMARHAVAHGITHLVVTPHIHPGRYNNSIRTIQPVFNSFAEMLEHLEIPLRLAMAAEVRISPEIIPMISNGTIPLYRAESGQQSMLLELPYTNLPPGYDKIIDWLKQRDIRVVLAHPERNKALMRQPEKLRPFIDMGAIIQLTAGSIAGLFGEGAFAAARYFLQQQWVHVIATDAHNLASRSPELDAGRLATERVIGKAGAELLVNGNPWSIAGGMFTS